MLMYMIGKLSKDLKADWLKHLPKLVHAYNCMRLAITEYSPHYFMFRHGLHLPINFYFPMVRGSQKYQCVDHYVAKLHERLQEAFNKGRVLSTSEAERLKWHYDIKANTISLEPDDFILARANPYKGRRKVKDQWEEELYEVECQMVESIPYTS